jgi:hypothetical protein
METEMPSTQASYTGPFDPRSYGRHANSRSDGHHAITADRGGAFNPSGFTVEPVQCHTKVTGETPIAQAVSMQSHCVEQHKAYLESLDAAARDPRALADPKARAQFEHQRRAFGQTEAAVSATTKARRLAADRTAEAEQRLGERLAALRVDGDAAQEHRNDRAAEAITQSLSDKAPAEALATAARMLENASTAELSILTEQLLGTACVPGYLERKGLDRDWVLPVLERRPEVADVATEVVRTRQAKSLVDSNASRIEKGIAEGHAPYLPLLDALNFDVDRL